LENSNKDVFLQYDQSLELPKGLVEKVEFILNGSQLGPAWTESGVCNPLNENLSRHVVELSYNEGLVTMKYHNPANSVVTLEVFQWKEGGN
jgi:hypothetical protein